MTAGDPGPATGIETAIEAGLKDGKVVIDSTQMSAGDLTGVFDRVFGAHRLAIQGADLTREKDGFTFTGTSSLFSADKVEVRIVFRDGPDGNLSLHLKPAPSISWAASRAFGALRDSALGRLSLAGPELVITCLNDVTRPPTITMGGALPDIGLSGVEITNVWKTDAYTLSWRAPDRLQIPGVPWLSIKNLNLVLEAAGPAGAAMGTVGCEIHAGDFVLPLAMALPSGGEALQLRGAFEPIALPGLSGLAALLGSDAFARSIPSALQGLGGFAISDFEILLNPRSGAVPYISLDLQCSESWQVIPKALALNDVGLHLSVLSPTNSDRAFKGTVSGRATIAGLDVFLSGDFGDELVLFGTFREASLSQLAGAFLESLDLPSGLAEVALRDTTFSVATSGSLSLASGLDLDFRKLAEAVSLPVPDGFAGFSLDSLEFHLDGADKSWTLELSSDRTFPMGSDARFQIAVARPTLTLAGGKQGGPTVDCAFEVTGAAKPADEVSLSLEALSCRWRSGDADWEVTGKAGAEVHARPYELTAAIGTSGTASTLQLTYEGAVDLCDWEGVGRAELKALSFTLTSETQGEGEGSGEPSSAGRAFAVSGDVFLAIDHLFTTPGHLEVETSGEARRLVIAAAAPTIAPIQLPAGVLHIEAGDLRLAYGEDDGEDEASWTLGGAAGVWFTGIPAVVQKYFPAERIDGSLLVGSKGVEIASTVPKELQPDFPPLALTSAKGQRLELGQPEVEIQTLRIALGKGRHELAADLKVTLPPALNYLLGWDEKGRPNRVFLNESFELGLSLAKQPTLALRTSPFKGLELHPKDGKTWSDWDFGEFAKFSLQTPEFSFADGQWRGAAAMTRQGPLKLPLAPVKFALDQLGLGALGAHLPAAVKLEEIDAGSDDPYRRLKELLSADGLSPDLRDLLSKLVEGIESLIDHLPDDFREYLVFRVPDSLDVEFAVGGGGATTFAIASKDAKPLKILLPTMSAYGPALFGLTFHKISLGQMLGGSLAVLEMDGYVDQFDLPMLLGAAALPDGAGLALRNRFTCTDVLAVAPTGLPIPIPLFYEELAWDLKSVVGLELATHWSYPKPRPSILDFVELFDQLKDFFTKSDYLLQDQKPPDGLKLEFTVGQNFIALPSYLGGAELGRSKPVVKVDVYKNTARLLDAMKTGNAGYLIEAIPLRQGDQWFRVGRFELRFGPVVLLEAGWCITTEHEYRTEVLPREGPLVRELAGDDADDALLALPDEARGPALDKGFIVLLMGGAGVEHVLSGRIRFGIAVTRPDSGKTPVRFQTGFQWALTVADALEIKVGGALAAQEDEVAVAGKAGLYLDGRTLVESRTGLRVGERLFQADMGFTIADCLDIDGTLRIDAAGITLSGDFAWRYASGAALSQAGVTATLGPGGMTVMLEGSVFGNACETGITVGGPSKEQHARIEFTDLAAFQKSLLDTLSTIGEEVEAELSKATQQIEEQSKRSGELEITLGNVRKTVAAQLRAQAKQLPRTVHSQVRKKIDQYFDGLSKFDPQRALRGTVQSTVASYVKKELPQHVRYMNNLAARLEKATDKDAKDIMQRALADVLERYDPYQYVFTAPKPFQRLKVPVSYPMAGGLKKTIQQAQTSLAALNESTRITVANSKLKEIDQQRKQLIDEIATEAQRHVDDHVEQVPQVQSVGFETGLGLLAKRQPTLNVTLLYKGEPKTYAVEADLGDMASCLGAALRELTTAVAAKG